MDVDLDTMPAGVLSDAPVAAPCSSTLRAVVLEALYELRGASTAKMAWRLGIDPYAASRRLNALRIRYPHLVRRLRPGWYEAAREHSPYPPRRVRLPPVPSVPFVPHDRPTTPAASSRMGMVVLAVYVLRSEGTPVTIDTVTERLGWDRECVRKSLKDAARWWPRLVKRVSDGRYRPALSVLPDPLGAATLPAPAPRAVVAVSQGEHKLGPLPLEFVEEPTAPRPVGCTTVEEFLARCSPGARRRLPSPIPGTTETVKGRRITYHRTLRGGELMTVATIDGREVDTAWPGVLEAQDGVRRRLGQAVDTSKRYRRTRR